MQKKMNEVLITGASGFVGQNLLKYLENTRFHTLGISLKLVPKPDLVENIAVVHLAGKAHDLKSVSQPDEYYAINFDLTRELYGAFLKSNAKKFIFISSVKASADQVEDILNERDIPEPKTHYGKSKLMAEEYIQSQPLPVGKSFYILRPCMIHGPGNKGNLNLLYKLISKGIPYPLAAFENERSFLSVENLCFVIRELLERDDIPSGIYNVSDDEVLSTNSLIKLIAQASDRSPKLWKINPALIRYIVKLGDLMKLPLTTERLNKLTESYVVDNSKIKNTLGKEFPVQAKEGIIKTIKSFQKAI
jgi:nucleoside-diphosphate-sugar epimerase